MALTASSMLPLGTIAPKFSLPDTISGNVLSLDELKSDKATVVMFICNHCPFVVHIVDQLVKVTNDYKSRGVHFIAISANDVETHPEDSPEKMKQLAKKAGFSFPYLYDESQAVAKSYHAECTPDFFVFDKDLKCTYRGRFDDSGPGKKNIAVTGYDLCATLDAMLQGEPVNAEQTASVGCNIKWKHS